MARPLRIEYPGALYHVMTRGNGKQKIFRNDKDRQTFLDLLNHIRARFRFICHAYCLMDNHYHLIIETPDGNLSWGMRQLNGVYTQKYNRNHKKTGHVFEGRFKAIIVDKDSYLLELSRYVVLNPVRIQMVEYPEEFKWSSYRSTIGLEESPPFLTIDWILGQFSKRKKTAEKLYADFVYEGTSRPSPWKDLKGQIFLGDKRFIEKHKSPLFEREKEIPHSQRYADRPELSDIFSYHIPRNKIVRDELMTKAHLTYGYTMKEISDYLGIHYATVSRAIMRAEKERV
jgi:putative transposase